MFQVSPKHFEGQKQTNVSSIPITPMKNTEMSMVYN